jgi:uncharacterized protein YbjT (DUF2867 family)
VNQRLVLLTGATGYVGGRLQKNLEALGVASRCLSRRPEYLRDRIGPNVEVVAGDVMDSTSLASAFADVHTACYLIHSMGSAGSFEDQDRLGAQNFAQAARTTGVQRIVYLGGLGDEQESLSPHLRSRHEAGDILRASVDGTKTCTEFDRPATLIQCSVSAREVLACVDANPRC